MADMQPPPFGSENYKRATEERRLVPMRRVSHTIKPLRQLQEQILPLSVSLKARLKERLNLFIPSRLRALCTKVDSATFSHIRSFIDYPTNINLFRNQRRNPTVRELWGILSNIILYIYPRSRWMVLFTHAVVARYSDLSFEREYIRSLIHHDILVVGDRYYEMRKEKHTPWWAPRYKVHSDPIEGSDVDRYKKGEEFVGFTFYNRLEIEAKANHLLLYMPAYDHLVYNCQAFQHNLRRRIVAHEVDSDRRAARNAPRALDGYRNQRSNGLGVACLIASFSSTLLLVLLLPFRYNYWYKLAVFQTCSWHGKPASNRVALTQLLAATVTLYMFNVSGLNIKTLGSLLGLSTDPSDESFVGKLIEIEARFLLCISLLTAFGFPIKLSHRDSHNDRVFPMLGAIYDPRMVKAYNGMKVKVEYFTPYSGRPVDGYRVTFDGLVPIVENDVPYTGPRPVVPDMVWYQT